MQFKRKLMQKRMLISYKVHLLLAMVSIHNLHDAKTNSK